MKKAFTRTKSGIPNYPSFHRVDLVVFTEGGKKSHTFEEVQAGKYNESSIDTLFWKNIFEKHNLNKSIKYKPLGSKTSTKKICELIKLKGGSRTVVAIDLDLNDFTGKKFNSPFILYTQGYSWENDVYHPDLIKNFTSKLLLYHSIPKKINDEVDSLYEAFNKKIIKLLKLELFFRNQDISFIKRCACKRYFEAQKPYFNQTEIKKLIRESRINLRNNFKINLFSPIVREALLIYGKLVEFFSIKVITYICKTLGNKKLKIDPKMVRIHLLELYLNRKKHIEDKFYANQINRLSAALV